MNSLTLYFSGLPSPQLQESVFSHAFLPESRHAVRGKGLLAQLPSFQWTAAVQALCLLVLRYKRLGAGQPLDGPRGSPASSLDYSISKRTDWLKDMFGVDRRGELIALRFLRRANTECRRGPRVSVKINSESLPCDGVRIFHNEREIRDPKQLLQLEEAIAKSWRPKAPHLTLASGGGSLPRQELERPAASTADLAALIESEMSLMLRHVNIFHRGELLKVLQRIARSPSVLKITKRERQFCSDLDLSMSGAQRLGLDADFRLTKRLRDCQTLRVAVPGSMVGALAIFTYLQKVKGYNLRVNYQFPHAIEIKNKMIAHSFEEPPHLCVLGSAPAASFVASMGSLEYDPLMLLPSLTHALVRRRRDVKPQTPGESRGDLLLLREEPSTSLFYFEDLRQRGALEVDGVEIRNGEPDEIAADLAKGNLDRRAILFFPHYSFNLLFNECERVESGGEPIHVKECILLAHSSLKSDPHLMQCVDIAVRDAWQDLLSSAALRRNVVDQMLDAQYIRFLARSSGLSFMRQAPDLELVA